MEHQFPLQFNSNTPLGWLNDAITARLGIGHETARMTPGIVLGADGAVEFCVMLTLNAGRRRRLRGIGFLYISFDGVKGSVRPIFQKKALLRGLPATVRGR